MHVAMMEKWNYKVRKHSDIVWVLGDVALTVESLEWLNYMNGSKRLVLGNHDTFAYSVYSKYFDKVYHFHKGYKGMVLTHIPIHPRELEYRSWKWNIHGHIHDPAKNDLGSKYFNVNMDIIGYSPIHLDELREQLQED
jgi:calcineurin-like phosphoesterase family protein